MVGYVPEGFQGQPPTPHPELQRRAETLDMD